jgi:hypothetical protein
VVEKLPEFTARYGVILDCLPLKVNPPNKFRVLILVSEHDKDPLENSGWTLSETPDKNLIDLENSEENFYGRFKQFLYFTFQAPVAFTPKPNPLGYHSHVVVEVEYSQILEVVDKNVRVDSDGIVNDIRRRETPRFS